MFDLDVAYSALMGGKRYILKLNTCKLFVSDISLHYIFELSFLGHMKAIYYSARVVLIIFLPFYN